MKALLDCIRRGGREMADPNREAEKLARELDRAEEALRGASDMLRELRKQEELLKMAGPEDLPSLRELERAHEALSDVDAVREAVESAHEALSGVDPATREATRSKAQPELDTAAREAAQSVHEAQSELDAVREAVEAVHEFRRSPVDGELIAGGVSAAGGDFSRGPITQEEAREWSRRREERRRREGYRSA